MRVVASHRLGHPVRRGAVDIVMPDFGDRGGVAMTHARRAHDADSARVELIAQRRQQLVRAHHLAGQAVADPDRERRRRRLALLDHVEVRIECCGFVHRRLGQPHLLGERGEMRGAEVAVAVLDQMQMLDQQIAPARPVAEQRAHLDQRPLLDLAPLGMAPVPPFARSRAAVLADLACGVVHPSSRSRGRYRCASKASRGPPISIRQQ